MLKDGQMSVVKHMIQEREMLRTQAPLKKHKQDLKTLRKACARRPSSETKQKTKNTKIAGFQHDGNDVGW